MTENIDGHLVPTPIREGKRLKSQRVLQAVPERTDLGLVELFRRFPLIRFGWDARSDSVTVHLPVDAAVLVARSHPDPYRIEACVFELEKAQRDGDWPAEFVGPCLDEQP